MNNKLFLALLFVFGLTSCTKHNTQVEDLNFQWTLVEYANILGQVHCQYDEGDVVWSFEDDKLKISGQLISPWALKPCYIVDDTYNDELTYIITESDNEDIIYIEELGLRAKISVGEELVIEIISSSGFKPSTEGVKVFFNKIR